MYEETKRILANLVKKDTTSSRSNLGLLDYVEEEILKPHGVSYWRIFNDDDELAKRGSKANLIARIGPDIPGGVLLSAHTDCVPAGNHHEWKSYDAFLLTEHNGRLLGRGTTDMKGFIACILSHVPTWSKAFLQKPIYVVLSYDEEVGCVGIRDAVTDLKARNVTPDLCIIGEPTEMEVAYAHKSRANIHVSCEATGGHASKINYAEITSAFSLAVHFSSFLENNEVKRELGSLFGDVGLTGPASFAGTMMAGAESSNVIPDKIRLHYDFRGRPGVTKEHLLSALQPYADQALRRYRGEKDGLADITLDVKVGNCGFHCIDKEALDLGKELAGTEKAVVVDYVCEAARFAEAGFCKTIVCGPGSIMDAHKVNESIDPNQLVKCLEMMERITRYAERPSLDHSIYSEAVNYG